MADNELINGHLKCDKVENYCKEEEVSNDSKESRKPEELYDSDAKSRWGDVKFNLELEQALSSLQLEKTKVRYTYSCNSPCMPSWTLFLYHFMALPFIKAYICMAISYFWNFHNHAFFRKVFFKYLEVAQI